MPALSVCANLLEAPGPGVLLGCGLLAEHALCVLMGAGARRIRPPHSTEATTTTGVRSFLI